MENNECFVLQVYTASGRNFTIATPPSIAEIEAIAASNDVNPARRRLLATTDCGTVNPNFDQCLGCTGYFGLLVDYCKSSKATCDAYVASNQASADAVRCYQYMSCDRCHRVFTYTSFK